MRAVGLISFFLARRVWQLPWAAGAGAAAAEWSPEGSAVDCWHSGYSAQLCCKTPPRWECFDETYTHTRCCAPASTGPPAAPLPPLNLTSPQLVARAELAGQRVDLVVRSYWKAAESLLLLARSLELYWPREAGDVVVVLDESARDAATCTLLPDWLRCIQEEPLGVEFTIQDTHALVTGKLGGMLRKELSLLLIERHCTGDYIAIIDSDVVFVSYGAPEFFFARSMGDRVPKPLQYGRASGGPFPLPVHLLGLPWVAEFMDSFPQVFHRRHFPACRRFIRDAMKGELKRLKQNVTFLQAFNALSMQTSQLSRNTSFPSFHSVMGSYVWQHHRDDYTWAIQYGWLTGVAREHTCPGLRVAAHVSYAGRRYVDRPGERLVQMEDFPDLAFHMGPDGVSSNAELSGAMYGSRAWGLMLAGVCGVPWELRHKSEADERVARWAETRQEACKHDWNLSSLVLSNGYSREWRQLESLHCAGRQPVNLLREYWAYMEGRSFEITS